MQKTNYGKMLEETMAKDSECGRVKRVLLHACCGPCSSYCLEYLTSHYSVTVDYYNPNISPEPEYRKRVAEIKRLISELPVMYPVSFREGVYEPDKYYREVSGLEQEPERGKRCEVCFRMRLREAAEAAKTGGFDYFTTTLSISPLKDAELLNRIGRELSEEYGVAYLYSDFKKKGGYLRSIELSGEYGLYRQNYCGCVFSKREAEEREREKAEEKAETQTEASAE